MAPQEDARPSPAGPQRRSRTGGASFSPQLSPRPRYPGWGTALYKTVVFYTRVPLLLALVTRGCWPLYSAALLALREQRGWSDRLVFTVLTVAAHAIPYGACVGFFALADWLQLMPQYKLRATKAQEPSWKLIRSATTDAAIGIFALDPIISWVSFPLLQQFGMTLDAAPPSLWALCKHYAVARAFNDVLFYWAHRALHSKALYARFHKQHHSFIETKAVASEFASPPEQVFANYLPVLLGTVPFGRHPMVFWGWLIFMLGETVESHSGYYFGDTYLAKIGLTNSEISAQHWWHHRANAGNFGNWHVDWLFGTMDSFVAAGDVQGLTKSHLS